MKRVLHILRSEPDAIVEALVERLSGDDPVTVTGLYRDDLAQIPVDWHRLVEDVFSHDKVICWW